MNLVVILATMLVFISRRNVINFFVFPCRPSVGIAGFLSFFFFYWNIIRDPLVLMLLELSNFASFTSFFFKGEEGRN